MIDRIAGFIIKRRLVILIIMLFLSVAGLVCMQKVYINDDMTKYLSGKSEMKQGLDIMDTEFPDSEVSATIRVMFKGLSEAQKPEVQEKLKAITDVESVMYKPDDPDYNHEDRTLYVLTVPYDYGTKEELAVETALDDSFNEYDMLWNNNDSRMPDIPPVVIISALIIILAILFTMCGSWIEPFLFLIVIGCAIAINMGSNIIMGSISSITFSIAALLQLALSMDYSIMLMNRYRQERACNDDKYAAMKAAISNAFSSIASSSFTTVVGLLMLVFMSFKIGLDLGVVLAKGVFISMLCVITMLPVFILMCDTLIKRTAKKSLHIPMDWAASFSYSSRRVMAIILLVLFIGTYFLQKNTGITYTLEGYDYVAEYFPPSNTLVLLYNNEDETAAQELARTLQANADVTDVRSYYTTFTQEYTAEEMSDNLESMSSDTALAPSLIGMLYYSCYNDGKAGKMTVGDFLAFVSDITTNAQFSSKIDGDSFKLDYLSKFSDPEILKTPLNYEEMAAFFDIDNEQVRDLYTLYFLQSGTVEPCGMTLVQFEDFISNELAADPAYASMFSDEMLGQLSQMSVYTDKEAMAASYSPAEAAKLLGMPLQLIQSMFTQTFGGDIQDKTMRIDEILEAILNNPQICALLGPTYAQKLQTLIDIINGTLNDTEYSPAQLSQLLGIQEEQSTQLCLLYTARHGDISNWKMSAADFLDMIVNTVMTNEEYSSLFDQETAEQLMFAKQLADAVVSKTEYSSEEMADFFNGMSDQLTPEAMDLIFLYAESVNKADSSQTMSLEYLFDYLTGTILNDTRFDSFIDDDMRETINSASDKMASGKEQLVGKDYSRMIITSKYAEESSDTTAFIGQIKEFCGKEMKGDHYLIGNSAMTYEMQQTYDSELLLITSMTAFAIFLIVLVTFRSFFIPALLVLLVQTGVFFTVTFTGYLTGSIYYLALIIVECILMGATIDYGILLTNYYLEARKTKDVKEALKAAYDGSVNTILTSGLILITITAIVGRFFKEPAVSAIVKTISMGALCAVLLILFVLPGSLASLDKLIIKQNKA